MRQQHPTTRESARSEARALLDRFGAQQLTGRWNFGPTTGSILEAIAATPERVRCDLGRLEADSPASWPATSTVYVRPPRPMRISVGPSQFYPPTPEDDEYEHPEWCECAALMAFVRDEFRLDFLHRPDEILPRPPMGLHGEDDSSSWFMLWWD
ncbi:hypothetical protein AAG589_02635 [Isoptericola sp. F-RaC21]|uniref:hypothetical protein n=1 Tax=Isoptericola sp. F-RaC21 TaxID=3141452 RepID=UPI00315BF109